MPRILRILNRFNLGGPTYNAVFLTRFLQPEFETLLLGGENDESEESSLFIAKRYGVEPVIIPEMKRRVSFLNDIRAYKKIKSIIREFKPDIVHTHASKAGALGRRAAAACDVPVIVHTFHGHVFDAYFSGLKSNLYKNIERKLAVKTTRIIALSDNQKEDLIEKYKICSEDKVEIIPLGFDLDRFAKDGGDKRERFRSKYKLSETDIAVGIIGRLVPIKNHGFFLDAFHKAKQKNPSLKALIIGDGESRRDIENKIKQLGLRSCTAENIQEDTDVILTSWIKDVDEVLAGLDVVALTSLNEGTPVSLIEAQAAGCPIVSTEVGGIRSVVIPGVTALLSPSGNIEKYTENLMRVTEDSEFRNKLGYKGWNFVHERFHYSRLADDMKNLYDRLLNSNKKK
ncbi:MAG: glycosyltransferase [Bacteroidota bacterium]